MGTHTETDLIELRATAEELLADVRTVTATGPDPRLQCIGVGGTAILHGLEQLERRARRRVCNMQRSLGFHHRTRFRDLDRRSVERHLDLRLVVGAASLIDNPLISSIYPYLRIGPVFGSMIVVDGNCAVLAGAPAADVHRVVELVGAVNRASAVAHITGALGE